MQFRQKVDWFSIVLSDNQAGGTERQQIELFKHLLSKNKKCLVICLTSKYQGCWEFLEGSNGIVIYMPFSWIYLKLNYLLLYPLLLYVALRYSINYSFTSQTLINASIGIFKSAGLFKKSKIIVRESNSIFKLLEGRKLKRYILAYKIGYRKVDLVICQTETMKSQLIKTLPWLVEKSSVRVIDNAINIKSLKEKSSVVFEESHLKPYLVAAGSLQDKKGFDILLESFYHLQKDRPILKLIILGEGKEKKKLEKIIEQLNLNEKVVLRGFVENVAIFFKHAEACVISSRIEGFPNVLLEMMSQNEKIISTLCAGGISKIPKIHTAPVENAFALKEVINSCLKIKTINNREVFDSYLENRNFDKFLSEILISLNTKKTNRI